MKKADRRDLILEMIKDSKLPISASTIAAKLDVSRQVIVGDVALLRASGVGISATPTGYIYDGNELDSDYGFIGIIACRHFLDDIEKELYAIVDFGGTIIDVTIDHTTYGQLSANLNIGSRYDASMFVERLKDSNSRPLSELTEGIHLHKIGCKDEDTFRLIKSHLEQLGISIT